MEYLVAKVLCCTSCKRMTDIAAVEAGMATASVSKSASALTGLLP